MKNVLCFLIILMFSTTSIANEQVEINLVQALMIQIKDFKKLGTISPKIQAISKEETSKGVLYRIAVANPSYGKAPNGAVLSILQTGIINKNTGVRVYKTEIERVEDIREINVNNNVQGLELIQGLLMQFDNFKQLASLGNTVTNISITKGAKGPLYRIEVIYRAVGVMSTGAVLSIQKRGIINKTLSLDVYSSEVEALEQKDTQQTTTSKSIKSKSSRINCASLFK